MSKSTSVKQTPMLIGASKRSSKVDNVMDFILQKYLERNPNHEGPIDPGVVCEWAESIGLYTPPPPITPQERFRRQFSRHLGQRFITDAKNREVRALIPIQRETNTPDGKVVSFQYGPLYATEPGLVMISLRGRLRGAERRVVQVHTDRESYIDFNVFGATLPELSYDFTDTVKEQALPGEGWPEEAPEDHDEDDDEV